MVQLKVTQAKTHDVYRDVVRIPESHRHDSKGRRVKEGSICWISVGQRKTLAWVRGAKWTDPTMTLDELLRRRLKVELGAEAEIMIQKTTLIGEIRWGLQASEAAYRVATMLAILSVALGAVSMVVAFAWIGAGITTLLIALVFSFHYLSWKPRKASA